MHRFKWIQKRVENGTPLVVSEWQLCKCTESHADVTVVFNVTPSSFVCIERVSFDNESKGEAGYVDSFIELCHTDSGHSFVQYTLEQVVDRLCSSWSNIYAQVLKFIAKQLDSTHLLALPPLDLTCFIACCAIVCAFRQDVTLYTLLKDVLSPRFRECGSWLRLSTILPLPRGAVYPEPNDETWMYLQLHAASVGCLHELLAWLQDRDYTSFPFATLLVDFYWDRTLSVLVEYKQLRSCIEIVHTDSFALRTSTKRAADTLCVASVLPNKQVVDASMTRATFHPPCMQAIIDAAEAGRHPQFNARIAISQYFHFTMDKEDARTAWYRLFAYDPSVPNRHSQAQFYAQDTEFSSMIGYWSKQDNPRPMGCSNIIKRGLCPFASAETVAACNNTGYVDIEECATACISTLRQQNPNLDSRFVLYSPVQYARHASK